MSEINQHIFFITWPLQTKMKLQHIEPTRPFSVSPIDLYEIRSPRDFLPQTALIYYEVVMNN